MAGILQDVVVALELDRLVRGAIHADLRARERREFQLETDLRAGVEAEESSGEVAEVLAVVCAAAVDAAPATSERVRRKRLSRKKYGRLVCMIVICSSQQP